MAALVLVVMITMEAVTILVEIEATLANVIMGSDDNIGSGGNNGSIGSDCNNGNNGSISSDASIASDGSNGGNGKQ